MPITDNNTRKEYMKEWARKRRGRNRQLLQEYKVKKGCADCGYNKHHAALEFDHIGTDKLANVASLMSQEIALWQEVAKCEVVCSNCHSLRTYERMLKEGKAYHYGPLE